MLHIAPFPMLFYLTGGLNLKFGKFLTSCYNAIITKDKETVQSTLKWCLHVYGTNYQPLSK